MIKKTFRILLVLALYSQQTIAIFNLNLFRAYDINLRPPIWCGEYFQWTSWAEAAYKIRAFNANGNEVNPGQIYTDRQNALAMLQGFGPSSPMTRFLEDILNNPENNNLRGTFIVNGDFKAQGFGFATRFHLPHNFTLGVHVPFYNMQFSDITFTDQTSAVTPEDALIKEELTSQLRKRIKEFDPSFNLHGWHKVGIGDLFIMLEWYRDFIQGKPILKNVALNARIGINLPTGIKTDIDDILFQPFGFDGAIGIIFGGGITLNWFDAFRGGIDVEFLQLFGNTRQRRIKVNYDQTDFLLLAKADAFKEYGFTQRFNLFLESYRFYHGFSARATYQFWKQSKDTLTVCTNQYSNQIANSAQSLQEWTMHQVIFQLSYDGQCDISRESLFKPQYSIFYKLPFNGERSLMGNTVGFTITLNF